MHCPEPVARANSVASELVIPEMVRVSVPELPLLVTVETSSAVLAPELMFWAVKLYDVGERLTEGPVPVPERVMVCGVVGRLSAMLMEADTVPGPEGVNSTLMEQPGVCPAV